AGQVEDGVDDLTPGVSAVPPRLAGRLPLRREQVLDVVPLEVRQVTRISLSSAHTSRVGDDSAGWEGRFPHAHLHRLLLPQAWPGATKMGSEISSPSPRRLPRARAPRNGHSGSRTRIGKVTRDDFPDTRSRALNSTVYRPARLSVSPNCI